MGGSGATQPQVTAMPTTPAPSASESAASIAQARLQYDPQMAASDWAIQQQYMPQQAALYQSLYNQYMSQMAATQQRTQQQLYPIQSGIMESGAQDIANRLANPNYMTPGEVSAQQASRAQATADLQKYQNNQANLGGQLYGGRTQRASEQGMGNLLGSFSQQDYANRMQAGAQTQSDLTKYLQILYPQVGTQQPNTSQYQYSSAVPSADSIYKAMYGASRPNYYVQPGQSAQQSPLWSAFGNMAGMGLGSLWG